MNTLTQMGWIKSGEEAQKGSRPYKRNGPTDKKIKYKQKRKYKKNKEKKQCVNFEIKIKQRPWWYTDNKAQKWKKIIVSKQNQKHKSKCHKCHEFRTCAKCFLRKLLK